MNPLAFLIGLAVGAVVYFVGVLIVTLWNKHKAKKKDTVVK